MKKESQQYYRQLAFYASIGFQFGFSIVIGLALGIWLDEKFDASPWFLMLCLLFGIAAGFRNLGIVIKRVRKF